MAIEEGAPTMEFAIEREEFIRGLSRVQSIIEKRTTLPILSNVLLETKEDALQIVGTDLEVGIKGLFSANIKEPGSITVPAKKLFAIMVSRTTLLVWWQQGTRLTV